MVPVTKKGDAFQKNAGTKNVNAVTEILWERDEECKMWACERIRCSRWPGRPLLARIRCVLELFRPVGRATMIVLQSLSYFETAVAKSETRGASDKAYCVFTLSAIMSKYRDKCILYGEHRTFARTARGAL